MYMIWHNDECVQVNLSAIFEETMFEDQRSSFFWEDKLSARAEVYKVRRTGLFHVRQISAVKDRHSRTRFFLKQSSKTLGPQPPPAASKTFRTQARAPALHES